MKNARTAEEVKRLLGKTLATKEETKQDKRRDKQMQKMRELTKKLLGDGLISQEMATRYSR